MRAAEREDAPKGDDDASLRQHIDAEHAGGAERRSRQANNASGGPISGRERRIVRDRQQVRRDRRAAPHRTAPAPTVHSTACARTASQKTSRGRERNAST